MTSRQHTAWIRRGKPYRIAPALASFVLAVRSAGYVVYVIGNEEHLDHQPPEGHTPYCEDNWPVLDGQALPDVVTACDIMPDGNPPYSLQALGAQIYADVQAGLVPWMRYMNWGPASNTIAVHDSWEPSHVRRSSTDKGHIHISMRSDWLDRVHGYDPIQRLRQRPEGGTVTTPVNNEGIRNAEFAAAAAVRGDDPMTLGGKQYPNLLHQRLGRIEDQLKTLNAHMLQPPAVQLTEAQIAAIADVLRHTASDADGDELEHHVERALRNVLRQGIDTP